MPYQIVLGGHREDGAPEDYEAILKVFKQTVRGLRKVGVVGGSLNYDHPQGFQHVGAEEGTPLNTSVLAADIEE